MRFVRGSMMEPGMPDSMDCSEIDDLVDAWLDGTLPSSERQGFDAHLARCEACRTTAILLRCTHRSIPIPPRYCMPPLMKRRLVEEFRGLAQRQA